MFRSVRRRRGDRGLDRSGDKGVKIGREGRKGKEEGGTANEESGLTFLIGEENSQYRTRHSRLLPIPSLFVT